MLIRLPSWWRSLCAQRPAIEDVDLDDVRMGLRLRRLPSVFRHLKTSEPGSGTARRGRLRSSLVIGTRRFGASGLCGKLGRGKGLVGVRRSVLAGGVRALQFCVGE